MNEGANVHQSEPKKEGGASSYTREPREHRTSSKKRRWITKGRSGNLDARPLRGSKGAGAKKGVVRRCRASTSHLPMERGELNEKEGQSSMRSWAIY